jgi:hypothetical protein
MKKISSSLNLNLQIIKRSTDIINNNFTFYYFKKNFLNNKINFIENFNTINNKNLNKVNFSKKNFLTNNTNSININNITQNKIKTNKDFFLLQKKEHFHNTQKKHFCENGQFNEKEDYIYIISIRIKSMKNLLRPTDPMIQTLYDKSKKQILSQNEIQQLEDIFTKLEKQDKISSALKIVIMFAKKPHYSKMLLDFFIDNCSDIANDSLIQFKAFFFYVNILNLKPTQINFNPNFFKVIEESFLKEGILFDLKDMKELMPFFYKFRKSFSDKFIDYLERCFFYLLENENNFNIYGFKTVTDIVKINFGSMSIISVQKVFDFYFRFINLSKTDKDLKDLFSLINFILVRPEKREILYFDQKINIMVKSINNLSDRVYNYIANEKLDIDIIRGIINLSFNGILYTPKGNLRDLVIKYVFDYQSEVSKDNLRRFLKELCTRRNTLEKWKKDIDDAILGNIELFTDENPLNLNILYNYLKNIRDPNPDVIKLTELIFIKMIINKHKDKNFNYPTLFEFQLKFLEKLKEKSFSGFLGFLLDSGNNLIADEVDLRDNSYSNKNNEDDKLEQANDQI